MEKFAKNKVVKNASWIIVSKMIQAVIGLVVSMLTARYLGPSNYGLINYASSMVGFVTPIVFLGLNNTLVQELTVNPENEGEIIGTSVIMSFISSLLCILGIGVFATVANKNETITIIVCLLYSLILIFQVFDLVQYWFQSKLLSKYSSITTLCAYTLVATYKIVLLVIRTNVYWFAIASAIEYALISLTLIVIYKRLGGQKFSFSKERARMLFSKSKYYIVTGLMVAIFAQTDKIMLKLMINEEATGFYSAATYCAGLSAFLYTAIIDSFRPVIFQSYTISLEKFEMNMKRLYSIIIYISLLQSIVMTLLANFIISILYGPEFMQSANALRIVTWYTTFSYLGSVRNIWVLSKGLQKYLWMINLSGAILNVIINLLLIPIWGIYGAAIASFATQFFANFIIGFIIKPIRENNKLIIDSLDVRNLISMVRRT